jgi:hypothetical protein
MKNEDIGLSPIRWLATLQKLYKNGGAYQNWMHSIHANKKFLCIVQGRLAAFSVIGAERHKTMRLVLQDYKFATDELKPQKYQDLILAKVALDRLVDYELAVIAQEVFAALKEHFSTRYSANLYGPRFCIKLIRRLHQSSVVYTYARDQGSSSKSEISFETVREKNTGFQEVSQSGNAYCCNDIVGQNGAYKNPRLNHDRLRSYSSSLWWWIKKKFVQTPSADEKWIDCWELGDNGERPPASSCYKSTLILPMTLLAKQVSEEFVAAYNERWPLVESKYNFGYLCVDCHEVDFFEDYDKVSLFAHADLFTLFLIEAYSFSQHSSTYTEVESLIKKQEKLLSKPAKALAYKRKIK